MNISDIVSGKNSPSWVICYKDTKIPIFETFNEKVLAALNTKKYIAIPIYEYLTNLNKTIKSTT